MSEDSEGYQGNRMSERFQVAVLAGFFMAWGHWWGSGGASLTETLEFSIGGAVGVWLLLWLSSSLDRVLQPQEPTP